MTQRFPQRGLAAPPEQRPAIKRTGRNPELFTITPPRAEGFLPYGRQTGNGLRGSWPDWYREVGLSEALLAITGGPYAIQK
ncbi:MAG: hypothetical protein LAO24_22605 [Acidobacteriia bacterium]|nr:hypothetical protein [Terriglobia bacterium]